jgi:hypothetical protein
MKVYRKIAPAIDALRKNGSSNEVLLAEDIPGYQGIKRYLVGTRQQLWDYMGELGRPSCYEVVLEGECLLYLDIELDFKDCSEQNLRKNLDDRFPEIAEQYADECVSIYNDLRSNCNLLLFFSGFN